MIALDGGPDLNKGKGTRAVKDQQSVQIMDLIEIF
jgi:hypothetical protein